MQDLDQIISVLEKSECNIVTRNMFEVIQNGHVCFFIIHEYIVKIARSAQNVGYL
jgi:hypothetical protein